LNGFKVGYLKNPIKECVKRAKMAHFMLVMTVVLAHSEILPLRGIQS
jgi:hypothetical protein